MELVDQHAKAIMEGCKERARDAGLRFEDGTLEYIVTNRDLLELSPKNMIPTLYDYWVHEVEVLKEKGKYELYPHNPYETVINTRPAISFYNDNNPDWLNVMIFYHVLGHIDFFQNNIFFRHTWDYDFTGRALSDKRLVSKLRSEKGRWVDYVIEFARGLDNLLSYPEILSRYDQPEENTYSRKTDYYFDLFIQTHRKLRTSQYIKEIERFNESVRQFGDLGEKAFFAEVESRYPEFEAMFNKHLEAKPVPGRDVLLFLLEHSPFLNREENKWMQPVIEVVRNTSLFFQPQIRTKIMNEGWASYWHDTLFILDERIRGQEVNYARVNAGVTSMPKVGLNPYALGMRLFRHVEELSDRGRYSFDFRRLSDVTERKNYDARKGGGKRFLLETRRSLCDFSFINTFVDQDFVDRHRLFVVGKRLNQKRMVWEYYVQSRNAADYRQMLLDALYHPPYIEIDLASSGDGGLYLSHRFEQKPLVKDFIQNTMMGLEFLWGNAVHLETSEVARSRPMQGAVFPHAPMHYMDKEADSGEVEWQRVVYTMRDKQLTRRLV